MRHSKRQRLCAATAAIALSVIASPGVASAAPTSSSTVQLLAWPSPTYLATMKPGDVVPTRTITTATNLAALPAMYHGVGGKVRVEEDVVPTTSKAMKQYGMETAAPSLQAAGFAMPANATEASACRPGSCVMCGSYSLQTMYDARQEIFDNLYTWYEVPATITETSASSHTLGIGYAVTGGSWSQSAEVSVKTSISAGAALTYYDHEQVSNTVNVGHYTAFCSNDGHGISYYRHETAPTGFHSLQPPLLDKQIDTSLYMGYSTCDYYSSGHLYKTSGSNIKFSAGLEGPFISVSAEAAYSRDTQVEFNVQGSSDVCGSDSRGWASADRWGAQPHVHCSNVVAKSTAQPRRSQPLC